MVVWRLAMSIKPSEMPFQQAEEHSRKKGSTDSSLELAPSPFGADDAVAGDDVVELERAGLVAAQAEPVPLRGLGLDLVEEGHQ